MSIELDTTLQPTQDQFAYWRSGFAYVLGMTAERDEPSEAPFDFKLKHCRTPALTLNRFTCASPCSFDWSNKTRVADDLNLIGVHYRSDGDDVAGAYEGDIQPTKAGDIRSFDFERPFWYSHRGLSAYSMYLNRTRLTNDVPAGMSLHGFVFKESPLTSILKDTIQTVSSAMQRADDDEILVMFEALYQLTVDAITIQKVRDLNSDAIHDQSVVQAVNHYIERHYGDPDLSVEMIGKAVGVSRTKLYRIFQNLDSPQSIIRGVRLKKAAKALREGHGQNIDRLAYQVGFSHRQTFSRMFQREYGMTPTEYRNETSDLRINAELNDLELDAVWQSFKQSVSLTGNSLPVSEN